MSHAKLSPSSSARWLNCTASVKASTSYANTSSSAAEEGTAAHQLGEICLKSGDTPDKYLGQSLSDAPTVTVDLEMVENIQDYVNYCRSISPIMLVEERVEFTPWVHDGYGTSDCIIFEGTTCHVIDLKYGKGVEVYAEENTQAMLYALGVLNEFEFIHDITTFKLHIFQPRRHHFDEWEISVEKLLAWGDEVKEIANNIKNNITTFNPGDKQCQWCAHKANCSALQKHTEKVISAQFNDLSELPAPEQVDHKLVLKNKALIESWLKAVEMSVFERLNEGEPVEGFKLVAGRSVRKWGDEQATIKTMLPSLGEDLYTKKLLTAPQAEKLIGKAQFNAEYGHLVVRPEGRPTLAPSDDKRPAIGDVTCNFEEL
tara:strand:+ start:41 stop:1156 length:1116 start_codon:yes stop_codon:yes gene_type:complete